MKFSMEFEEGGYVEGFFKNFIVSSHVKVFSDVRFSSFAGLISATTNEEEK